MLDLIRDIILATDLAHHLRIFKDLQKMADGMFQQGALVHPTVFFFVRIFGETKKQTNKERHKKTTSTITVDIQTTIMKEQHVHICSNI